MENGKLSKLIDKIVYEDDAPRDYIGASNIGSDCLRQIWYEYTNAPSTKVSNKTRRTWEIGRRLEDFVIDLLKLAGIEFKDYQVELRDPVRDYFRGHFDGLMVSPESILEIKTAKDASFKIFVKDGCKKWSPRYYAQVQAYMGMSGIHSAYILVLNKDNSEIHDEHVDFDAHFYITLVEKARLIHEAEIPPPRINGSPLFYQCKMCRFRETCHE